MKWEIRSINVYYVVCKSCGATTLDWFGWNEVEAVKVAIELGWQNGVCESCLLEQSGNTTVKHISGGAK
jgi:hypothetical protein